MNKWRNMFTSKLQQKIFISYLLLLLFFTVVIFVFSYVLLQREEQKYLNNIDKIAESISNQTDDAIENMNRICLQLSLDGKVYNNFWKFSGIDGRNFFDYNIEEKKELQEEMLNIVGPDLSVGRCTVYDLNGNFINYGKYSERLLMKEDLQDVRTRYEEKSALLKDELRGCVLSVEKDFWGTDKEEEVVSLSRFVKNVATGKIVAIAEVDVRIGELCRDIGSENNKETNIMIYTKDDHLIYESNSSVDENTYAEILDGEKTLRFYNNIADRKELISVKSGDSYGLKVVYAEPYSNVFEFFRAYIMIFILVMLLVLALTTFTLYKISQHMTAPLMSLYESVRKVRMNHFSVKIEEKYNIDIVSKLNEEFKTMFSALSESVENEIKANLLAMQAQMNPHFIYNMLSVISAASIEGENEKVTELCCQLSRLLRYAASKGNQFATLQGEVDYALCYCKLMQARYEDKLKYDFSVEGELNKIQVPKLIIQPLIENAFKHGFTNKEDDYRIQVRVIEKADQWEFVISDNGSGISEERQQEIIRILEQEASQNELEKSGLGIKNTIFRLRMFCRETIYYLIENMEEGGLRITIGGVYHDNDVDC